MDFLKILNLKQILINTDALIVYWTVIYKTMGIEGVYLGAVFLKAEFFYTFPVT